MLLYYENQYTEQKFCQIENKIWLISKLVKGKVALANDLFKRAVEPSLHRSHTNKNKITDQKL